MIKIPTLQVIALLTMSYAVTKFIEFTNENYGGELYTTSQPWKSILSLSAISPWTVVNACRLLHDLIWSRGPTEISIKDKKQGLFNEQLFIVHDIVHNFTAFMFHTFRIPLFAWLAMLNFPLWFTLIDRSLMRKDQLLQRRKKGDSMLSLLKQQDPLLIVSMMIYVYETIAQGQKYLLSGTGLIHLTLPFCQRRIEKSIVRSAVPLGILFVMEHGSIMLANETCHNVVHMLSHFLIAKFANDFYRQYIQVDRSRCK